MNELDEAAWDLSAKIMEQHKKAKISARVLSISLRQCLEIMLTDCPEEFDDFVHEQIELIERFTKKIKNKRK
jgi:hypothetical protein